MNTFLEASYSGVSDVDELLGGVLGTLEEEREVEGGAGLLPGVKVEVLGEERVGGEGADVLKVGLHLGGVTAAMSASDAPEISVIILII